MLHLASVTDPEWAVRAARSIDLVLLDHAHLEKKAAGNAVTLLFRYPEHATLLAPLSRLAREELEHFELMLSVLSERGLAFERLAAAPYAGRLRQLLRPSEPERLIDLLLVSAVIEARSCERMQLLALELDRDPATADLARVYRGLLAAEARHHGSYLDLAGQIAERSVVSERLAALAAEEAAILARAPTEPRLHNR